MFNKKYDMNTVLTKLSPYGKFFISNHLFDSNKYYCDFDLNLSNGSTLKIESDYQDTPEKSVQTIAEKLIKMKMTIDFEDGTNITIKELLEE